MEADRALVLKIGGQGTPTILVNGVRLGAVPDSAALDRIVRAALAKATTR